ncbi:MAG: hypothetical protein HUJ25_06640 [Crocinitomicaceae bacterium]|nr:hypothetical protein [Crocinitomicaceae bacterium]
MTTITLRDETNVGTLVQELEIQIENNKISVKDLIAARVKKEVDIYNQQSKEFYTNGLVMPTEYEKSLNSNSNATKIKRAHVDFEKQLYVALEAFQRNGFFILIDDEQCESLEMEVMLSPDSKISFLKLTPLVGG